jgi:hypothetical protein
MAYARVVEVQKRGLIHLHIVVWVPQPLDVDTIHALALEAGFGCVMDLAPLDRPDKTARYLAKYVSKSVDQRGDVPWVREMVDQVTGEVTVSLDPTFRAWSSSRNWGVRMADLVAASRRAVAIAAARRREEAEHQPRDDEANATPTSSDLPPP